MFMNWIPKRQDAKRSVAIDDIPHCRHDVWVWEVQGQDLTRDTDKPILDQNWQVNDPVLIKQGPAMNLLHGT